jgi:hypothetical protein
LHVFDSKDEGVKEVKIMNSLIEGSLAMSGILAGMLLMVWSLKASEPRPQVVRTESAAKQRNAA